MELPATRGKANATANGLPPALDALVVAPLVGNMVLMLVAVGAVAVVLGALAAVAGYSIRKPHARRKPP